MAPGQESPPETKYILSKAGLATLLQLLRADGRKLIGPTVQDGAIVHSELSGIDDLPEGWTETQKPGSYRLIQRSDSALFGYSLGPQSFKQLFFAPHLKLFQAERTEAGFTVQTETPAPRKLALVGARSCDLHAIDVQDRIFLRGDTPEADYAARRSDVFVIAVHCGQAGGTCFCASMNTGPRASLGFDLALTELLDPQRFVVDVGSERGAALLARVSPGPATESDLASAEAILAETERSMGRSLDTAGIKELLYRNQEHPRWDAVAERCLSCTNCTLACPTCFCASVEDVSDLEGTRAERSRRWDSCFSMDHSYVHGGSVRASTKSRYRQWLTHKLASWIDQFGVSGCVGCGRCITWCPVGIDITEEVAALREGDGASDEIES